MMSDQSLEKIQNLSDILSSKESYYLTFNSNKTDFNIRFANPLKLNPNRKYECALQYFSTSNYLINITENNNNFYYSADGGSTWITITLEEGAYELVHIQNEIKRQMVNNKHADSKGEPYINIGILFQTFKSFINIRASNPSYKVDFTKPKTFRKLLGFKKILDSGYHISDSNVQITSVSSILIHCDIISGSYHNGKESNVIFSIPAFIVPSGYKMNVIPPNMFYLQINRSVINSISFRITDEEENILNFKGEELSLAIHIRQV